MLTLLLFLLMPVPEQGGRVVLNVGVPAVEFSLDGNFVAVTDEHGTLTMENFPAGSFRFSIVKKGYLTYSGTFSISEGESKLLSPALERIRGTGGPNAKIPTNAGAARTPVARPQISGNGAPPAESMPPSQVPKPAALASAADPIAGPVPAEEPQASALPFVVVVLFVIASSALGIWGWSKKRTHPLIPPLGTAFDIETPPPPGEVPNRPAPGFIEELKRREELLNAGFVETKPRVVDPDSIKGKEVVIVLPKEAFRYEDDK